MGRHDDENRGRDRDGRADAELLDWCLGHVLDRPGDCRVLRGEGQGLTRQIAFGDRWGRGAPDRQPRCLCQFPSELGVAAGAVPPSMCRKDRNVGGSTRWRPLGSLERGVSPPIFRHG